ncbi:MAG: hypothetical protein KDD11_23645, partial [Acidobacteria bacterium]|nr:hypothetical protein [Acidobacteriota bacterium]
MSDPRSPDRDRPQRTAAQSSLLSDRLRRTRERRAEPTGRPATIPRRRVDEPIPLSSAQERLWFLDRLQRGSALFNIGRALRLRGSLSVRDLARSLTLIVSRHEALRTAFPAAAGAPRQEIVPAPSRWLLPVVDLTRLEAPDRETEAADLARREAARPLDLERPPLLRTRLVRLAAVPDAEHELLLTVHHLVFDGWSLGVLLRELGAAGRGEELPPLP